MAVPEDWGDWLVTGMTLRDEEPRPPEDRRLPALELLPPARSKLRFSVDRPGDDDRERAEPLERLDGPAC